LNPDVVEEFLRNTYEQYAARFSRYFGRTVPGSFFDEIFNLRLAWDPLLEERFRARKGYALSKVLPLMHLDGGPETIKIRCDYFEELARLYEEAWFRRLASWPSPTACWCCPAPKPFLCALTGASPRWPRTAWRWRPWGAPPDICRLGTPGGSPVTSTGAIRDSWAARACASTRIWICPPSPPAPG